jgi:invasion protein IalB
MTQVSRGFLLVAATAALAACASHAPVKSAGTAAAPQAGTSVVPKGYYRKVKGGNEYYCRMQGVTGSHTVKNEVCVTPDELAAQNTGTASIAINPAARQQR